MKKIVIDENKCVGCGLCEGRFPEVFCLREDGISEAKRHDLPDTKCADAIEWCPVKAISIEEQICNGE